MSFYFGYKKIPPTIKIYRILGESFLITVNIFLKKITAIRSVDVFF